MGGYGVVLVGGSLSYGIKKELSPSQRKIKELLPLEMVKSGAFSYCYPRSSG